MPCYDCGPIFKNDSDFRDTKIKTYENRIAFLEAALCASLGAQLRKFEYKDIYTIKFGNHMADLRII